MGKKGREIYDNLRRRRAISNLSKEWMRVSNHIDSERRGFSLPPVRKGQFSIRNRYEK